MSTATTLILCYDYGRLNFPKMAAAIFLMFHPTSSFPEHRHTMKKWGLFPHPLSLVGTL